MALSVTRASTGRKELGATFAKPSIAGERSTVTRFRCHYLFFMDDMGDGNISPLLRSVPAGS